jgi:hypothetical protein
MDKVIEYVGEVLSDGHLSVPEEIRQALAAEPHAKIKVTIRLLQSTREQTQEAWEALYRLGHDAEPGQLRDAAADHDRYLYSKEG